MTYFEPVVSPTRYWRFLLGAVVILLPFALAYHIFRTGVRNPPTEGPAVYGRRKWPAGASWELMVPPFAWILKLLFPRFEEALLTRIEERRRLEQEQRRRLGLSVRETSGDADH